MTYIRDGRVASARPWSITEFFSAILNGLYLFIMTLFTTQPLQGHITQYNSTKGHRAYAGGSSSPKTNVHGMAKASAAGCSGGS